MTLCFRASTDKQAQDGNGVDTPRTRFDAFAADKGLEVIEVIVDEDMSRNLRLPRHEEHRRTCRCRCHRCSYCHEGRPFLPRPLWPFKLEAELEARDQELIGFEYLSETWPLDPPAALYDYIYLQAITQLLSQHPEAGNELAVFEAFTDVEFNPKKSLSCQARTCSLFIGLGGLEPVRRLLADPSAFRAHLVKHEYGPKSPRSESVSSTLF